MVWILQDNILQCLRFRYRSFHSSKNAHQSGGYNWSSAKKEEFANYRLDPDNLIAVNLSANRSKLQKAQTNGNHQILITGVSMHMTGFELKITGISLLLKLSGISNFYD